MSLYNFKSVFKEHMNNYIKLMISKGYKEYSFYYLFRFDTFLITNNYTLDYISKELIDKWAIQLETECKNTRNERVSRINQFCRYLNVIGVKAYISFGRLSRNIVKPYVLSKEEIIVLFNSIDKTDEKRFNSPHYKYLLPMFFRLLYSCGLRNNEACCLKIENIDFTNSVIKIYEAKNKKDRLVYLSLDMNNLLKKYISYLRKFSNTEWLFPNAKFQNHIDKTTIDGYFLSIVKEANIGTKDFHPVPHSLRHTYVVHRVDSWLKEGKDANKLLIYLSKQLGHSSLEETYYYYHTLESSFEAIRNKSRNLYPEVTIYEE